MERIAAIVVTYNRKALLEQCLSALVKQCGAACEIFVVDNASSDGTRETVQQLASRYENIRYRNTGENLGGAGGFHFGIRWAMEDAFDYLWIMDDDCIPQPDALAEFLKADRTLGGPDNYGWLSSLCLWKDGALCTLNVQRATPYKDIAEIRNTLTEAQMATFVSLFVPVGTVKVFGLPIKEFFIWADDWEYTRRISRKRKCYVVGSSKVVHSTKSNLCANIVTDTPERLPRYWYSYRNDVYLYRREGVKGWIWILVKNTAHSVKVLLAGRECFSKWKTIWGGFFSGVRFLPPIEMWNETDKAGG